MTSDSLLSQRNFRHFILSRFLVLISGPMINLAMGQYVFERTKNPLDLGYIGLSLFLPKIFFSIYAGHIADLKNRRSILIITRASQTLLTLGLLIAVAFPQPPLALLYAIMFGMGAIYAFDGPANQSILPSLVPLEHLTRAIAWNSSTMQVGFIAGPALAGFLYAIRGQAIDVFYVVAFLRLSSLLVFLPLKYKQDFTIQDQSSWKTVFAGLKYVFQKKVILGAISLDLFAVLFGGAVALLPAYANDILKVGPSGLGMLRAAPGVGATVMALVLARLPPLQKAGKTMLACVAIFGLFTILFGVSKNFAWSLLCLFILGAADMVSVVVRGVLVQTQTPPEMRGRVNAVNLIFIGASNELGEFESGLTAAWFGIVPSVILGGLGTLAVVGLWAWKFPELRAYKKLSA